MKLSGFLHDPLANKASSTRLAGLILLIAAVAFAFLHPDHLGTLVELLGAGLVALGLRKASLQP